MKLTTKAVLLSALVFPGLGHVVLKRLRRGLGLIAISFLGLAFFCIKISQITSTILEKIQRGDVSPDLLTLTQLVHQELLGSRSFMLNTALILLMACWVFSIVDCYRIGIAKAN